MTGHGMRFTDANGNVAVNTIEPPVTVWTFERSLCGSVLHLIPPDPWNVNRVLCGPRADVPAVDGFEVERPDLEEWPTMGCLRCKRVYAARLRAH